MLIMASKRFLDRNNPFEPIYIGSNNLFASDIKLILKKGQHPCTITREALHIYCDAWRTAQRLSEIPKEGRDRYFINHVPCMEMLHIKPDRNNYFKMIKCPIVPTHRKTDRETVSPSNAVMRDWSKAQRDVYILYGTVL